MKVVLLCGGIGQRMFPITEDKFLLKFLGKTLLEYQIETARGVGLTEFIIVGNPQNINRIAEIIADLRGIKVDLAIQKEPLGMADALESARQFWDDEVIIVNPNDVFDGLAYSELLEARRTGVATSYLLGCEVTDYFPGGYLVVDDEGNLTHIVEKPERGNEPSNLVNLVVHLHTDIKRLLQYTENIPTDIDEGYEFPIDAMVNDRSQIKVDRYTSF